MTAMECLTHNMERNTKSMIRLGLTVLRLGLVFWFAVSSMGFPSAMLALRNHSQNVSAIDFNDGCRCSIKKKLSGTCCCLPKSPDLLSAVEMSRENVTDQMPSKSCCSKEKAKTAQTKKTSAKSCCASKFAVAISDDAAVSSEHAMGASGSADHSHFRPSHRCGCNSNGDVELNSWAQWALPAEDVEPVLFAANVDAIAFQCDGWSSLRHQPPEPPPRA